MATRLLLLIGIALSATGCASIQDYSYNQSHRFKAYWNSLVTGNSPILNCHYTDGYRAGYYEYSTGRRCKPPVLPPSKYWASCYQSCEGQKSVAEWYRGYECGMLAAEKVSGNFGHQIRPRTECLPVVVEEWIPAPPTTTGQPHLAPTSVYAPPLPQAETIPNIPLPSPALGTP